jgi:hypothetical protein
MSDELVNQQISSNTAIDELDRRILRALEVAPELHVPADFAARVSRQLPARRPVSLTPTHYGRNAVLIGTVITLVALLALTLHHGATGAFGLVQSLLLAQFVALTVWLSIRRKSFS